jgi:hypothetical protein
MSYEALAHSGVFGPLQNKMLTLLSRAEWNYSKKVTVLD